jgi:hypothetical protein
VKVRQDALDKAVRLAMGQEQFRNKVDKAS